MMNGKRTSILPAELREHLGDLPPEDRRDMELVWDRLGRDEPREIEAPGVDEAWAELSRRTAQASARPAARRERPPVRPRRGRRARSRAWSAVAVVAALVAIAVGSWWWHRPVVVTAPPGAIATVQLPDGSAVELNSDSELSYRRHFQAWPFVDAAVRRVALRGEGFFAVARSERPFVVETADARVEALGTQFNVRARGTAADRETTVTLASGRVRVSLRGEAGRETVLAEAGASARVVPTSGTASELVTREGPLGPVLAWRRRAFSAVDRPLASILAEVERHFAVAITVEGPLALSESMTVFYGPQVAPEDILHDLCLVQGCRFRRTSRGFAVTAKPAATPGRDV